MLQTKLIADTTLLDTLTSARTWGIILWVGLAVFTMLLIVLMRTKWGQARPLAKCVVLSVFAHILLVGYAYGTKLIFDAPAGPAQHESVKLRIVSSGKDDEGQPVRQPPKEWERFVSEENVHPEIPTAKRRVLESQPSPDRKAVVETPSISANPNVNAAPTAEPIREVADAPHQDVLRATEPADPTVDIERSNAVRQPDTDPIGPTAGALERMATARPDGPLDDRVVSTNLPSKMLDARSSINKMTEVAFPRKADALASSEDQIRSALNRIDGVGRPDGVARPSADNQTGTADSRAEAADRTGINDAARHPDPGKPVTPKTRLGDGQLVPQLYGLRDINNRLRAAQANGGNERTEAAVEAALKWLAANQGRNGGWDASQFHSGRETQVLGHNRLGAGTDADTGITALALLAFMGAGHSHLEGDYRQNVQFGLEFLLRSQHQNGSLAGNARLYAKMYCHGMATLAISEAFAITGDHRLKPFVERAVDFSIAAQHPTGGSWRYQKGDQDLGDMSQFGWQVMALKSAELAGIEVPAQTRAGMLRFVHSVSSGAARGLASYRPNESPSRTMTAEALVCRYFLGMADPAAVEQAAAFIAGQKPDDSRANLYYWYYATLALHQTGGERWTQWNEALQHQLLSRQKTTGPNAGSWAPNTVWGSYGGRVYSTAMAALCLEVYYRYLPISR